MCFTRPLSLRIPRSLIPRIARAIRVWGTSMCVLAPALLVAGCSAPNPELGALAPDAIDYNWHVRPILSENCFKCHGPDPAARKADLRLDLRELATAELPKTPGKH